MRNGFSAERSRIFEGLFGPTRCFQEEAVKTWDAEDCSDNCNGVVVETDIGPCHRTKWLTIRVARCQAEPVIYTIAVPWDIDAPTTLSFHIICKLSSAMQSELINTVAAVKALLDNLPEVTKGRPHLYLDLEGDDLSRSGTLSILTILVEPENKAYLVDVTTLRRSAFDTTGANGRTLRSILESSDEKKVFFDIRNDSDALFSHYGICVAGIEDLQLMELASRRFSKRLVNGLAKCIENDADLSYSKQHDWKKVKDQGRKLFDPKRGGTFAVFDQRPLSADLIEYCVQDVALMPRLRQIYRSRLCDAWWEKIEAETKARIQLSQSPAYNGKGRHMAEGPRAWLNWSPTPEERRSRTLLSEDSVGRDLSTLTTSGPSTAPPQQSPEERVSGSAPSTDISSLQSLMDRIQLQPGGSSSPPNRPGNTFDVWFSEGGTPYPDESDSRDFTACDAECGYCGRCDY